MTEAIAGLLAAGNFEEAVPKALRLAGDPEVRAWWTAEPLSSDAKLETAGALFEVLAYVGRNLEARTWVTPWLDKADQLQLPDCRPRIRLQAVEYAYALRRFEQAAKVAADVFSDCERHGDGWGGGEAAYYAARSWMRRHRTSETYDWCDRALERFSTADDPTSPAVRWRMGLTLLVSGFAGLRAGELSARQKFLSARTLLGHTGDPLGRAHVEQSLGALYRSMGARRPGVADDESPDHSHLDKARERFDTARTLYASIPNPIHLARLETNVGRTYLDQKNWKNAETSLESALLAAQAITDPVARSRHRAEALVYRSWLSMTRDDGNLTDADRDASDALTDARGVSLYITAEALLALGGCQMRAGRLDDARSSFVEAVKIAESLRIAKLLTNAQLCMADLLSQPTGPELTKAFDYWRLADAALPSLHSRYLSNKAKEIGAKMASRRDVWMVFRQEVLDPTPSGNRFRKLGERLDRWIIDRIEEEPDLTMSERARRLGVTPSGYLQKKRALDDRPRPS